MYAMELIRDTQTTTEDKKDKQACAGFLSVYIAGALASSIFSHPNPDTTLALHAKKFGIILVLGYAFSN